MVTGRYHKYRPVFLWSFGKIYFQVFAGFRNRVIESYREVHA